MGPTPTYNAVHPKGKWMLRNPPPLTFALVFSIVFFGMSRILFAQEEDLRFQVVDLKGKAFVYRDEDDVTARLHKNQKVDDGDKIFTDPKSEIVLRLKGRAYLRLASNSKIVFSKLRWNDARGVQLRINLVKGRMLMQLDRIQKPAYEITAGKMLYRAHGTLFDASRKKEVIYLTSYDGVMVANFPSQTVLVKEGQVMRIENGRFRYKHYLKTEDKARLEEWQNQLSEIRGKHSQGSR